MKITSRSVLSFALLAASSALSLTALAAPPSGQGIVILGRDCNSPTPCGDNNADSLAIDAAKVGSTVWAAVQASGYYNWGFFGSSLTAPSATFYSDFPTMCRWYSFDVGTSQQAADRVKYCPPNENYDYWVGSSCGLATPNDGSVDSHYGVGHVYQFGGRSLTLEGGTITHCSKGMSICDFGDNVTIKGSCTYSFPALGNSSQPVTRATAKVEGSLKFEAGTGMNNQLQKPTYLDWSLSGGADAKVLFTQMIQSGKPCTAKWFWCGDCSAFTGRFVLNNATATESAYSILAISNSVVNGTVEIQKYERLQLLGDDAFVARAEIADGATLDLEGGQVTRIGTLVLDGRMNFKTRSSKLGLTGGMTFGPNSSVSLVADAEGAIVTLSSGAVFDLGAFVAAVKRGTGNVQTASVKLFENGDGTKSVIVTMKPTGGKGGAIDVDADATISGGDAKVRVSVAEGKTLDLINGNDSRMPINLKAGATINIRRELEDWSTIPTLWLDASAANSVSNLIAVYEDSAYNHGSKYNGMFVKVGTAYQDTEGNPYVVGWFDWREGRKTYKVWNQRYDEVYNDTHSGMPGVHPRRVKEGLNGMDYLSFDLNPTQRKLHLVFDDGSAEGLANDTLSPNASSPRLYMNPYDQVPSSASRVNVQFKYAFLVFGSHEGGGDALLAGNAKLVRAGTTHSHQASDAILASNDLSAEVWLDGTAVDPVTTGFNRDWQVVTLFTPASDGKGTTFNGLGFATNGGNDNGGQRYAEIILVNDDLTERQRQSIEIYLAEKWGLADKYHYPDWAKDPFATVYGAGTVKLEADAKLGGAFKGTVDLNGNDLVIDGAALPPTEEAINTTALEGWYDPDAEGKTREAGPARLDLVPLDGSETIKNGYTIQPELNMIDLIDRVREKTEGSLHLYGQPQRAPWLNDVSRGFGPRRKWMEFSNLDTIDLTRYKKVSDGKVLRFSKVNRAGSLDGNTYQQPMQTLFMVQDSVNGGGHPFADGENVNSPVLYKQRTGTASAVGQPIYPAGTADVLTKGQTYVDGREVDGLTESFGARPEVLTVVPTETFNVVAIGQLGNSENIKGGNTEVIGEVMIYNRKLEAAERKVVEAYLSYKWLGLANEGYSDLTAATVTGVGKVTAASAALLPKFAADFTGTVSVPLADGLAFTLATDTATTVVGALDLGGGALEIPSGTTSIDISVAKSGAKPKAGSYKLIGWTSKPTVTWNLTLDGWTRESTALRVADDGLYLDLEKVGMTVLIR